MTPKITFLGLGVMGFPMAGHLSKHYAVTVFNRSADKAQRWVDTYGGEAAPSPAAAVTDADIVFCCLGADEDVEAVLVGEGAVLASMKSGALLCDHTTTSAELARRMGQAAVAQGIEFVDAPVSGGQKGAEDGVLTVMMGGSVSSCERLYPVLECYAKRAKRLGDIGAGQLTKMVNQICIAGLVQGLAEGIQFARNAGIDKRKENREASTRLKPRNAAAVMVMPEREVPGTSAIACAKPMNSTIIKVRSRQRLSAAKR